MGSTIRRPNFLYIGPDKAGSTWLFELLRAHPQAFVPAAKDIYFFDRYYRRGLDWYLSFFRRAGSDTRILGEISHDYLFSAEAAERIRDTLPGVRLLAFLRDPVQRSFSQYLYIRRSGSPVASLAEAIERYPRIVDNSRYSKHLRVYLSLFPRESLGAFVFEDLKADEASFMAQVLSFLALDHPQEPLSLPGVTLGGGAARSALAARLAKAGATWVRELRFPGLVGMVKRSSMVQAALYRPFGRGAARPKMSEQEEEALVALLLEDMRALPGLLGWDGLPDAWGVSRARVG
jgi:hypothetical protein